MNIAAWRGRVEGREIFNKSDLEIQDVAECGNVGEPGKYEEKEVYRRILIFVCKQSNQTR